MPWLNPSAQRTDTKTVDKGHVNNVSYVRYAETGRVNWIRNFGIHIDPAHKEEWTGLMSSTGIGLTLKSIKIDFKFPMTSPDKITVYHKLSQAPTAPPSPASAWYSSWNLDALILSEARQRAVARCHEAIATYDYDLGRKVEMLPQFMFNQFRQTWELQQEAEKVWGQKIGEIEGKVRALEMDSWDREDAVEDMGSVGGR